MAKEIERSGRGREVAPRYSDPFGMLRSEMDRLFDTFFGGGLSTFPSPFGSGVGRSSMLVPRIDVKETDKEIIIEAELPGAEEKDISVTLQNGILTLQGGKKIEYDGGERELSYDGAQLRELPAFTPPSRYGG